MGGGASSPRRKPSKDVALEAEPAKEIAKVEAPKKSPDDAIFDAHCHYLDYTQNTEGIEVLVEAMDKNGVGKAALCGSPLKKAWDPAETEPPICPIRSHGSLYPYPLTDVTVIQAMSKAPPDRFLPLCCGMNLADVEAGEELIKLNAMMKSQGLQTFQGVGEIVVRKADITNMSGADNGAFIRAGLDKLMEACVSKNMPLILGSNCQSMSVKPYEKDFDYMWEVDEMCGKHSSLKILWVACGVFERGEWEGYANELKKLMEKHENLYLSITPWLIAGTDGGHRDDLSPEVLLSMISQFPDRFLLGTSIRGVFTSDNVCARPAMMKQVLVEHADSKELVNLVSGMKGQVNCLPTYDLEVIALKEFLAGVKEKLGAAAYEKLRFENAEKFYHCTHDRRFSHDKTTAADADPHDTHGKATTISIFEVGVKNRKKILASKEAILNFQMMQVSGSACCPAPTGQSMLDALVDQKKVDDRKQWHTIDCHLHLHDFLGKSSGTQLLIKAMDDACVDHAVMFGMPCVKKWTCNEPVQPLYYQDDNGSLYVYSFGDQMIADAWLALDDTQRKRIAPTCAAFNPTDLNAVYHLKRLLDKYPRMWRGVGEVMCRHDDLTTMLQERECPSANHPALMKVYEWCVEKDLPILVHHNSDRVGDCDGAYQYVHEVEEVLKKFPTLKFVWVHAGCSRRVSEETHHKMCDRLFTTYPNLRMDISWVVWEDVICDPSKGKNEPKDCWVEVIEKHNTKIMIGSDNVAQYWSYPIDDVNLLSLNIKKYWNLFDKLSPEAGQNVAFQNAYNLYWKDWEVPLTTDPGYEKIEPKYPCEILDAMKGEFIEQGKY